MMPPPLAKKLRWVTGQRSLVLNAPPDYAVLLPSDADVTTDHEGAGSYAFVQLFVRDRADLAAWLSQAMDAAAYDAVLWVCYPKGGAKAGTDLNRDSLDDLVKAHGLRAVTQIAIDERWSALRFRPPERVGH